MSDGSLRHDPYLQPQTSFRNRMGRVLWAVAYALLFRLSPRPLYAWRAFLLRCFGARIGPDSRIYPKCRIWAPWNLVCEDTATIADEAILYNPTTVFLDSHAIVSQQAYLCGATHDIDDARFPMVSRSIRVGAYAWVCARASVLPGVEMGEGAVLGLGSVATRNLDAWAVYAGIPAQRVRSRTPQTLPSRP